MANQNEGRKAWTVDEDHAIKTLVKKHGVHRWSQISKRMHDHFGSPARSGKQCRQRWHNHLNPKINKQAWTSQEQQRLYKAHQKYGNKWKQISKQLLGRTDNDIKNKFYSSMRKKLRKINKLIGIKNSTPIVKQIRPKILSNILNDIQKSSPHLMNFLLQFNDNGIDNMGETEKRIGKELIAKIEQQNYNYLHDKDGLQDLKQIPVKLTRSKKSELDKSKEYISLKQIPEHGLRLKKRSSKKISSKMQQKYEQNKIKIEEQEAQYERNQEFNFDQQMQIPQQFTPGIFRSYGGAFQQYPSAHNRNRSMLSSPMFTRNFKSPIGPSPSPNPGFGGILFEPKPSDFHPQELNNYVDNLKKRIKKI